MQPENIDYNDLKKRGFLQTKENEVFTLRLRMPSGNFSADNLKTISEIASKYGKGTTHLTVRQGIEIPFIPYEKIEEIESFLKTKAVQTGTSGPRLRPTTTCPGSNWCKRGLVDPFAFGDRIENDLGIHCGLELPHKFKIVISGCSNSCTRIEASEIGLHGMIDTKDPAKPRGYVIYIGGCGGRTPRKGIKLAGFFSEENALSAIKKIIVYFEKNAEPRQRLGALIEERGENVFFKELGLERE